MISFSVNVCNLTLFLITVVNHLAKVEECVLTGREIHPLGEESFHFLTTVYGGTMLVCW